MGAATWCVGVGGGPQMRNGAQTAFIERAVADRTGCLFTQTLCCERGVVGPALGGQARGSGRGEAVSRWASTETL